MRGNVWKIVAGLALIHLAAGCAREGHPPSGDPGYRHAGENAHHRFDDAEKWAKVFEAKERDAWQKPDYVLALLDLPPDAKVADIGSSTGYFAVRFARTLPEGRVYGVDIEPEMDRYLKERAAREGIENLTTVLGAPDDPRIPEPVDLIFVCNTYHHIEERVAYFAARREDLLPGGRIAIVDFLPGDLPIGPPAAMKIPPEGVTDELGKAGYVLLAHDGELPYQYVLLYGKAGE